MSSYSARLIPRFWSTSRLMVAIVTTFYLSGSLVNALDNTRGATNWQISATVMVT